MLCLFLSSIKKYVLLFLALLLLLFLSAHTFAAEKTYTITESQLTKLETNLTELKKQNEILQAQLTESKNQLTKSKQELTTLKSESTKLQTQVNTLTQSLTNAKALLNKYEANNSNDKFSVGLGLSNNGVALNADPDAVWIFFDTDTAAIGYKVKF